MKPKVAFICVHNSCRSQMAEALGKYFALDVFESYSAGTEIKKKINQDSVLMIKKYYKIDMNQTQYTKTINDIPTIDILITMGCNVVCPALPCKFHEDWNLEDPTGKTEEEFYYIMKQIEEKILQLKNNILNHIIEI